MPWLRSLLVFGLLAGVALAADWPQWLGATRDAVSSEKVEPWKGDLKDLVAETSRRRPQFTGGGEWPGLFALQNER